MYSKNEWLNGKPTTNVRKLSVCKRLLGVFFLSVWVLLASRNNIYIAIPSVLFGTKFSEAYYTIDL